jgi:hypothetical protein
LLLLAYGAWVYLRPNALQSLDARRIHSVEVRFEPWGEDAVAAPGAESRDPQAIAALVAVLRSAEETTDHKCGSRGVITLHSPRQERLEFLPGHHEPWYEVRYAGRAYRMPRAEFIAAMKRIGVDVPRECGNGG